jgi:aminoglycoside/choline kinase family phosphotransferase
MASPIPHEALARAARAAFGAATQIVGAEPLAGDASSRRYVRLRLAGGDAPETETAIAMLLGTDRAPLGSDELGGAEGATELPFVNVGRYLAAHGFPVPALYHDATLADGLLLLEDVGDTSLYAAMAAEPARAPALLAAAVDLLVALQAAGARDPDPACYAFRQRFDGRLARWELEHFVEHGIETRHGRPLPPAERTALLAALAPIAAPFDEAEPVLAHRDFMAWNIHVQGDRLRLIDFQDALLAPDGVDLAGLLTDRKMPGLVSAKLEEHLVGRFRDRRAAVGLPVRGDLGARYRLCALQRALKVIGRFYFLERVKGKPGYLAYLPDVYAVARRCFDAVPALAEARRLAAAHVPELA